MTLFDFLSDAFTLRSVDAETPEKQPTAEQSGQGAVAGGASAQGAPAAGTDEESDSEKEVNEADAKKSSGRDQTGTDGGHDPRTSGGDKGGDDEEEGGAEDEPEEEEEEEDEPEDLKPRLEEECANSGTCAPAKHHYDDCVERVTTQMDENDGKAKENCVEEFFHLAHCATACAAPKLWKALK
ncbi:Non-heme 11 kDa protein of cytochrome bc1 complex [Tothia fuscella]|uniref:Cytochrome b-c1 complex subunit 6, mitochondrial n=1 Tax=Tothia fuscella TaxID=1048955 RepID=A0A9P4TZI0_9PEZI|nr:Non-heme 11 kDa protein of cytochrome bc1 complex [Tothia fuscella]